MTMHYFARLAFEPWQGQKIVHLGPYPTPIAWDMARVTAKACGARHYSIFLAPPNKK